MEKVGVQVYNTQGREYVKCIKPLHDKIKNSTSKSDKSTLL